MAIFPELVQSEWSEEVDSEGDQHRVISYTLSLNYSIGPKTSPATEKQVSITHYTIYILSIAPKIYAEKQASCKFAMAFDMTF